MEKLKQVGEAAAAEGPLPSKRDRMSDGQSSSVEEGNVSRGEGPELPREKFSLFLEKNKALRCWSAFPRQGDFCS